MLYNIAEKCADFLLSRKAAENGKRKILIYGFELWWSFFFCNSFLILWGTLFNCLNAVIICLFTFISIRIPAGGYHAKSYRNCFFLTNGVVIFCVIMAYFVAWMKKKEIETILYILWIISIGYIWKKAPAITKTHLLSESETMRNRKYAHWILIFGVIGTVILKIISGNYMIYVEMITLCVTAFMIKISEEERNYE